MADQNRPRYKSENLVWDTNTLDWVAMGQPVIEGGTININTSGLATEATLQNVDTNTDQRLLKYFTGEVEDPVIVDGISILTPSSGKKLRIHYISYCVTNQIDTLSAANPSVVGFKFNNHSNTDYFLYNRIVFSGTTIAKDFGDFRYIEGDVNEALNYYQELSLHSFINIFYTEV
jgi:hypothetical protein